MCDWARSCAAPAGHHGRSRRSGGGGPCLELSTSRATNILKLNNKRNALHKYDRASSSCTPASSRLPPAPLAPPQPSPQSPPRPAASAPSLTITCAAAPACVHPSMPRPQPRELSAPVPHARRAKRAPCRRPTVPPSSPLCAPLGRRPPRGLLPREPCLLSPHPHTLSPPRVWVALAVHVTTFPVTFA